MAVCTYLRGKTVLLSADVKNETGQLLDPTTLTLTIKRPDGTTASYAWPGAIFRAGLGQFQVAFLTALAGRHYCRWVSTGPDSADEREFIVAQGEFTT